MQKGAKWTPYRLKKAQEFSASRTATSAKRLEELSRSKYSIVRMLTAVNDSTQISVVKNLLRDPKERVRACARAKLLSLARGIQQHENRNLSYASP